MDKLVGYNRAVEHCIDVNVSEHSLRRLQFHVDVLLARVVLLIVRVALVRLDQGTIHLNKILLTLNQNLN